jgi:hypothetical protein
MNCTGLFILGIGANIADVRIGQGDDLFCIGGIGQNFLIAGHCGIEYHLPGHLAFDTNGNTAENTSVCKRQQGRFSQGDLRISRRKREGS